MNKKRLYKSPNAVMGGICGGIAEYYHIDPTLVRVLSVVLLIICLGIPAIFYVILLIILPPDPGVAQGYVDAPVSTPYSDATQNSPGATPQTSRVTHAVSDTAQSVVHSVKSNSSAALVIGAVLIGVGVIALLSNVVHISVWRFWPVVLMVVGFVCLFTPNNKGWSLTRAGNSIVLISIGLALLAWMLQIIQTRVFIVAFLDLWPVLLVVAGFAIIGAARKSSVIVLASSLVFAAMIILGLWFYGGLDWESVGTTPLLTETDGFQEFLADISRIHQG